MQSINLFKNTSGEFKVFDNVSAHVTVHVDKLKLNPV